MVADGLRNLMPNLVPASDAVNKGIGRGAQNEHISPLGI